MPPKRKPKDGLSENTNKKQNLDQPQFGLLLQVLRIIHPILSFRDILNCRLLCKETKTFISSTKLVYLRLVAYSPVFEYRMSKWTESNILAFASVIDFSLKHFSIHVLKADIYKTLEKSFPSISMVETLEIKVSKMKVLGGVYLFPNLLSLHFSPEDERHIFTKVMPLFVPISIDPESDIVNWKSPGFQKINQISFHLRTLPFDQKKKELVSSFVAKITNPSNQIKEADLMDPRIANAFLRDYIQNPDATVEFLYKTLLILFFPRFANSFFELEYNQKQKNSLVIRIET